MGRPSLPKERKRETFAIRLTRTERDRLDAEAEARGLTSGELARLAINHVTAGRSPIPASAAAPAPSAEPRRRANR